MRVGDSSDSWTEARLPREFSFSNWKIPPPTKKHQQILVTENEYFLADRTNRRAIGTVLRLSVVCNVKYCG